MLFSKYNLFVIVYFTFWQFLVLSPYCPVCRGTQGYYPIVQGAEVPRDALPSVVLDYWHLQSVTFWNICMGYTTEHSSTELRVIRTNAHWANSYFLHLTLHT